jgi:hypothetical protein
MFASARNLLTNDGKFPTCSLDIELSPRKMWPIYEIRPQQNCGFHENSRTHNITLLVLSLYVVVYS